MKLDPILKDLRQHRDAMYQRLGNDGAAWLREITLKRQALERQGWVFQTAPTATPKAA
jgi:hypothetical protein